MNAEQLDSLIDRLEGYAVRNPDSYRLRVALLAILGYAYLIAIALLLLGLVVITLMYVSMNVVLLKVLWIPLVVAGLVLRALWVSLPEPDGHELTPEQAPQLFAVVREIQEALDGPKVSHILLSDEFNAGIVQIPRFGMFGWLRNYLIVGLPLLKGMSPEEFRAVLAHEFGHLSGKHGRFSAWIYRVRESWVEVLNRVSQSRYYAPFMFEPFLKWYAPFFKAYSFVLARAQEFEADSYAVDLTGKEVTGQMLVRLSTKNRFISDEFWPSFYRRAAIESKAPRDPFGQLLVAVESPVEPYQTTAWVLDALKVQTGHEDTHPSLARRLIGIGYQPQELNNLPLPEALHPEEGQPTAADSYLREIPAEFLARSDRLWREQIEPSWREAYQTSQTSRERLQQLEFAANARPLTSDELIERARIVSTTESSLAAMPLIKEFLEMNSEHAEANFIYGLAMLDQGDAEGLLYLEKAMSVNHNFTIEACQGIHKYYLQRSEFDRVLAFSVREEEYRAKAQKFYEAVLNAVNDRYDSHSLPEDQLTSLKQQLSRIRGLGRTYLVRKIVDDPLDTVYVLAFFAAYTWREGENAKHVGLLIDELAAQVQLKGVITFISLDQSPDLVKGLECVSGSVIMEGGDETVEYRH